MIAIMMTMARTRAEFEADYKQWCFYFKKKPGLIIAHEDLQYEFPEQRDSCTEYNGVRVVDLGELIDLHGDQLGYEPPTD